MALSKVVAKSLAPGGAVFLLGLPCGVLVGLIKLLVALGVAGRDAALSVWDLSLVPGNRLDMKLAIVVISSCSLPRNGSIALNDGETVQ